MGKPVQSGISVDFLEKDVFLLLSDENSYNTDIAGILQLMNKPDAKVCYVCVQSPRTYVVHDLAEAGIDVSGFFFVDTMSSHYGKPKTAKNCVFLETPYDLDAMIRAINDVVEKNSCNVIVFDTISGLLVYRERSLVVRFVHDILRHAYQRPTKKLFAVVNADDELSGDRHDLVLDLEMFADKKIDMGMYINHGR
jgi:KaiC/GvpD/RAD55 family RecA-like ATPase